MAEWSDVFFFFPLFCSNTFVLEYCGEVLDHKEFKARVKEYARNKNIHYYFMALKNDEVSGGIAGLWLWGRLAGLSPHSVQHQLPVNPLSNVPNLLGMFS